MMRAVVPAVDARAAARPAGGDLGVQLADELGPDHAAADAALVGDDDHGVAGAVEQPHGVDGPRDRA